MAERRERRERARRDRAQHGVRVEGLVLVDAEGGRWKLTVSTNGSLTTERLTT